MIYFKSLNISLILTVVSIFFFLDVVAFLHYRSECKDDIF